MNFNISGKLNKIIEKILNNSLYFSFIISILSLIVRLKYLTYIQGFIFELCLFIFFSISYFLIFKNNMSNKFIKSICFKFTFLLFISYGCIYLFDDIYGSGSSLIPHGIFYIVDMILFCLVMILPSLLVCILTLIIINKLFNLKILFLGNKVSRRS